MARFDLAGLRSRDSTLETVFTAYLQPPPMHTTQKVIALLPAGKRVSREERDIDKAAAERIYTQIVESVRVYSPRLAAG